MNYSINKLREILTTKYIGPLMDYTGSSRTKEFEKLKKELLEFSEDLKILAFILVVFAAV